MKKYLLSLLSLLALTFSCQQDDDTPPTPMDGETGRLSILPNFEFKSGIWQRNGFIILDLQHDDNKDKKFMIVDIGSAGYGLGYGFVLKRGPLPIDSLATNWPASVKSVSYGYSNGLIVDAYTRMQHQGTIADGRFTYVYDSLHKFSSSIMTLNYMHHPAYAGAMVGKTPQGRATTFDGEETSRPHDYLYYFKEGYYTETTVMGRGAMSLGSDDETLGFGADEWKEIDAVMNVESSIYTRIFFDFDTWRYFAWEDFCTSTYGAPCPKGQVKYSEIRSMDVLMDWPEGWGPKR